ncbi:4Fe-4S dicluster domain-containing protein [Methanolobus sp. WCC4]|uniref:4Fe-4S dicluster domain-containing protein n=1 Tax=Methanolobus sp. WCC4 TaxID=3125784 RepID=UPI0030FB18E3
MPSNIERCYQCGQCTSVCPMGEQEQTYKIRKFLQMEKRGLANEESMMLPFIFYCTTCYRCQDNCPQEVKIVDGVLEIRANAVHNGQMLRSHRKVAKMLFEYGHAVPTTPEVMEKRLHLGLDKMPPTVQGSDEQLDEINTLLQITGFDRLLEDEVPEIKLNEGLTCVQQPGSELSAVEEGA